MADCKFRMGDFAAAIPRFQKAYKADPGDGDCLLAIGNCHDALKKPRLAERYVRKALALGLRGRAQATAWVNLGNALLDQQRWAEAAACFEGPAKRRDAIGVAARKNQAWLRAQIES